MYRSMHAISGKANIGILTKVAIFVQGLSWKTQDTKVNKTKLLEGRCQIVSYIKWIKIFQNLDQTFMTMLSVLVV